MANVENDEVDRNDRLAGFHRWRGDTVVAAAVDLDEFAQTGDAASGQVGDAKVAGQTGGEKSGADLYADLEDHSSKPVRWAAVTAGLRNLSLVKADLRSPLVMEASRSL